ncbi:MAG: UbiD family decarboxylase [archaeon]
MKPLNFQQAVEKLREKGMLEVVSEERSIGEIAEKIKDLKPILFENTGTDYKVAANVCGKELFEAYFDAPWKDIRAQFGKAAGSPGTVEATDEFPFEETDDDFESLPIPMYYKGDGGKYITAGVFVIEQDGVRNLSYHRTMIVDGKTAVVRLCKRHLWDAYEKNGNELDVAICIGLDPALLSVASFSTKEPMDETEIAAGFYEQPLKMVKMSNGISVPRCAEIVILGKITKEQAKEGPFVDSTGTMDGERQQPVFKLEKVLRKKDAIFYALVPGRGEHSFLMGVSKEPILFNEIAKVADIQDISFADGGIEWMGAVVSIKKKSDADVKKVIETAFATHKSLKHVWVFDEDIDLLNHMDREWAFTTRFQGDKDIYTYPGEPGSSLDPSSEPGDDRRNTCKVGFDCTIPMGKDKKDFEKVA